MDQAALDTTREHGLDEGDFLPFAAVWPPVRDGYLALAGRLRRHRRALRRCRGRGTKPRWAAGSWSAGWTAWTTPPTARRLVIDYKTEAAQPHPPAA
jgi:ATP-dependent helicase/nuclease subunit B